MCPEHHATHRVVQAFARLLNEGPVLATLPAIGLHQLHAAKPLLKPHGHLVHLLAPRAPGRAHPTDKDLVVEEIQRHQQEHQEAKLQIQPQTEAYGGEKRDQIRNNLEKAAGHHTPNRDHIAHDPRHHLPRADLLVEGHRQGQDVPIDVQPDLHDQLEGDVGHQIGVPHPQPRRDDGDHEGNQKQNPQKLPVAFYDHIVDDKHHDNRRRHLDRGQEHRQQKRDHKPAHVRPNVDEQFSQILSCILFRQVPIILSCRRRVVWAAKRP